MKKVLLSVLNQWEIRVELAQSLLALKSKHHIEIYFSNLRPIESNRNHIAQKFLDWDYTDLVMIDDDIVFNPKDFDTFIDNETDICSGFIWTNKGTEKFPLAMRKVSDGYKVLESLTSGLNEVDATGTGLIKITRKVLESMKKPFFKFVYDEDGIVSNWEDFNFCDNAKKAGFKIFMDTRIKTQHFKTNSL